MADTQLQLSQLSYQDATDEEKHSNSCASSEIREDTAENEKHEVEPSYQCGSQAQPFEISSSSEKSESDNEPRRSGRVRRVTRALQSQLSQIEHGLIPAPGAKGKARALGVKKRQNTKVSQLEDEFKLVE